MECRPDQRGALTSPPTDQVNKMDAPFEMPAGLESEDAIIEGKMEERATTGVEGNQYSRTGGKRLSMDDRGDLEFGRAIKIRALDKYNLRTRSIQNRIETEKKHRSPRRQPKPKQKPPPLSKYRRRTANERERTRMQEINDAFENLKRVVPQLPEEAQQPQSDKLTKITTLRLAVNYMAALTQILKQGGEQDENTATNSAN